MSNDNTTLPGFKEFGLDPLLIRAINDLGYVTPTSIQEQTINQQLAGQDVLGQAQTGTGKTAAYALPLLNYLDIKMHQPQALILTPTRELAIQVSEAFEQFAKHLKGIKILPVYGGADMRSQLIALKKGVHIVVGTPGRVMDHIRRNTLKLESLKNIVLDEADEMLNMGFQEDVEWILEQAPEKRQMALFSATIPPAIKRIARRFMHDTYEITVKTKTTTAATIHQRYWMMEGLKRLDALARILEIEDYDGVIIFVRTRAATVELAQALEDRGFNAAPLNGDIPQHLREQTVDRLKAKRIDILVATDVAARGLDVERISHVINYDIPHDAEAYIHRVGRTGRAGRNGEAILFVARRDRGMLRVIEKATRQKIEELVLPGVKQINERRILGFKKMIADKIETGSFDLFRKIVQEMIEQSEHDPLDIAAAVASIHQGDVPLLLKDDPRPVKPDREIRKNERKQSKRPRQEIRSSDYKMAQYRVEIGHVHGVKPGNLLGAIANEAGLDGRDIGKIIIRDDFSLVSLPEGMPADVMYELKKVRVAGQQLRISLDSKPGNRSNQRKSGQVRKNKKSSGLRRVR